MTTRRAHNKTRLGCGQCKSRRVKCDGKHPRCASCEKRGLDCSFLLLAPSTRLTTTIPPYTTSHESILAIPRSSQFQVLRLLPNKAPSSRSPNPEPAISDSSLEIPRLPDIPPYFRFNDVWRDCRQLLTPHLQSVLFHFDQSTSLTLATDSPAKAAWQSFIPELASRHRYLVHALLAIASLHLGKLHTGEQKQKAMEVAASQMNKALARYRRELENVNADNAAALFASATLCAVYFFRTSALDMEEIRNSVPPGTKVPSPVAVDKMVQSVIKIFWGLRGPIAILVGGETWVLGTGKLEPVVTRKWWPNVRVPANERALEEDRRLCKLESLWMCPGRGYESHFEVLTEALAQLREVYALVSQLTLYKGTEASHKDTIQYAVDDTTVGLLRDRGAIFVWAAQISRSFLTLIEEKNREALVLVAHYAVLLGRVRSVWWLEGIGTTMIISVAMALGRANWHLIQWPVDVVNVDLENAFGAQQMKDGPGARADEHRIDVVEDISEL
ncbi:hypothetical protein BDV95DRAFT_547047 [Massariosphaeria phaeospora]|uniref:Zn(2)-C6 fungal-type domain-containing protein n=1 Tax=Massariosphaeria phaeospora TaxID=100035 RepID=A0A7C8M480_9PLEO|nr:hypothetical protein BDV95DRAFT_547047 [Massariosphaeria phaeospora]